MDRSDLLRTHDDIKIASLMICNVPCIRKHKLILSACDSVWSAAYQLPSDLEDYFSNELGGKMDGYGGLLQLKDPIGLGLLERYGLYASFRCVHESILEHVQTVPPLELYESIRDELICVGWDVVSGNGWLSASCHGLYPIDEDENNKSELNDYSLFDCLKDCLECCEENNLGLPEHAPWFPVAVCLDANSYERVLKLQSANRARYTICNQHPALKPSD